MTEMFSGEMIGDESSKFAHIHTALDAPVTQGELDGEFPNIDVEKGEWRIKLAIDAVFRREYAPYMPVAVEPKQVATRGLLRGVIRRRDRAAATPALHAPEKMITRLCHPVTGDLTVLQWEGIQEHKPTQVVVSDMSPIGSDHRRRRFGQRQILTLDGATGVVTRAMVQGSPGRFVESDAPVQGANLFEWGNLIEGSVPVAPGVVKDASVYGKNYTRTDVLNIAAKHMGPDWANSVPSSQPQA